MRAEHWFYTIPLRLRSLFRPRHVEAEMDEELRHYLECKIEEGIRSGLGPQDARTHALRALGGLEQRREDIRDARHLNWLRDFAHDLRYAFRGLRHTPGFTAIVIGTLGVGIGSVSAIFSLADGILFRPLPVLRPSEVVSLTSTSQDEQLGSFSWLDYLDLRGQSRSYAGLVAFAQSAFALSSADHELPETRFGFLTSANFFDDLGVRMIVGRAFRPEEGRVPGRDAVAVLGYELWKNKFGSDASIAGKHLRLNGVDFTIIGVAPEHFGLDPYYRPSLFVPLVMSPRLAMDSRRDLLGDRSVRELSLKGRLRAGISVDQARAEARILGRNLERAYPAADRNRGIAVKRELQLRFEQDTVDAQLVLILGALAAAVLFVACANVAALLLSRARARSREIAVRLAIGASRFRLIRLLLTESLAIAAVGSVLGIAIAYGAVRFLQTFSIPSELPLVFDVRLDTRVLLFALGVSLLSAVLAGLAPARQTTRTDVSTAIKSADSGLGSRSGLRGRKLLVAAQVAASLALLAVASMMIRAFQARWASGPGFRVDHLLTMKFNPRLIRFDSSKTERFYTDLLARARTAPGVRSATLIRSIPMDTSIGGDSFVPEGFTMPAGRDHFSCISNLAAAQYFSTMGIPILHGREFLETDSASSTPVAIVNQQFANHFWPHQTAIGKRIHLGDRNGPLVQIVGIARDSKYLWIGERPMDFLYLPMLQQPHDGMTLVAQSAGDPDSLAEPLRALVRDLEPDMPVLVVRSMDNFYHQRAVRGPEMINQLIAALGFVGLVLAMAGLYGLISFQVTRRTREIGIRIAIGAHRGDVLVLILKQGLALVGAGLAAGMVLSYFGGLLVGQIVPLPRSVDFITYAIVLPALVVSTLVAIWIPARRASRLDPMKTLRYE